jgi:triphosphoribosyl-dephospho-CoA synthase
LPAFSLPELADCLKLGLRQELFLTPKPGLVDLLDRGSHPDLSLPLMLESVEFVGEGFQTFARLLDQGATPLELVPTGRLLEKGLLDTFGTNTHKGAIFLGGLLLCAHARSTRSRTPLPQAVRETAAALLPGHDTGETNGARIRDQKGMTGILGEARRGLPALFETALPALDDALLKGLDGTLSGLFAMARLMQEVEDTTTLHRCGATGLHRLQTDGRRLEALLLEGTSPYPFLRKTNLEYISQRLTMGGVADLLGMSFGLFRFLHNPRESFLVGESLPHLRHQPGYQH